MATAYSVPGPDGDVPLQTQVTRFMGREITLTWRYSFRTAGWHLDIDEQDTRHSTGLRVRPGVNLFCEIPGLGTLHVGGVTATADRLAFAEKRARLWYHLPGEWDGMP